MEMDNRAVYVMKQGDQIVYVGETGQEIEDRLRQHRTRTRSPFKGVDLEIEIIAWCDTRKESHFIQRNLQRSLGLKVDNEENQIKRSRAGGIARWLKAKLF
jgi:predicted GIY-YIG superfamily endonuclease